MPRELSPAERDDLTPGEIAAIMGDNPEEAAAAALAEETAATDAAARAAEAKSDAEPDPDDEEEGERAKPAPTAEEIAAAAEAEAAAKAAGEGKSEPSKEDLAALLTEEDAAQAPAAPTTVTYKGISEADYKSEAAKLNAEKATAMKDLMDGTIDAEAYAAIEASVADKRDDLVAQRTLARANQEAREQSNAAKFAEFQSAIGTLMKTSGQAGAAVNYNTDAKAQKQFDDATKLIASDPDNEGLSPQQVCDKAHGMVLALRGIVVGAPAAAPAAPAKVAAVKKDPPPTTLGGLPAAAPNATGNDLRAQFAALSGEEAEEFLERLPKAQRQALAAGGAV